MSEREELETTREACRDLGGFLRHVRDVTAEYREGGRQLRAGLTRERSARVVSALGLGTFEELDWSRERWAERLKELDAGQAGELHLAPGLGYSLRLVVSGDRELLVPSIGRIRFEAAPSMPSAGRSPTTPAWRRGSASCLWEGPTTTSHDDVNQENGATLEGAGPSQAPP